MIALLLKELRVQILSARYFCLLASFTAICGMTFFTLLNHFNPLVEQAAMVPNQAISLNELVIEPYWAAIRTLLLFLVPILAMRTFAAEREEKTFPLLCVSPVSSIKIVSAKLIPLALSALLIIAVQGIFPALLYLYCDFELGPTIIGGVGVFFLAATYLAIGAAVSAFSRTQITAGALSFLVLFIIHSLDSFAPDFGGAFSALTQFLSPNKHLTSIETGIIRSSDISYFLSIVVIAALIAAERIELERGA